MKPLQTFRISGGARNKQHINMEDLEQAHRAPSLKNEHLEIVDDEHESSNDVLEIDMKSFSSEIQSKLNNSIFIILGIQIV